MIVSCYELLYVMFNTPYKDVIFLKDYIFIGCIEHHQLISLKNSSSTISF
jgi:hypothetical protein